MKKNYTKDGYKLALELQKILSDYGLISAVICSELLTQSRKYAKIQEAWCNDAMNGEQTSKVEKREAKLQEQIKAIAKTLPGVKSVQFTGDPRGYTVRLMLANDRYNTWGGKESGWGIA